MKINKLVFSAFTALLFFASCDKEDVKEEVPQMNESNNEMLAKVIHDDNALQAFLSSDEFKSFDTHSWDELNIEDYRIYTTDMYNAIYIPLQASDDNTRQALVGVYDQYNLNEFNSFVEEIVINNSNEKSEGVMASGELSYYFNDGSLQTKATFSNGELMNMEGLKAPCTMSACVVQTKKEISEFWLSDLIINTTPIQYGIYVCCAGYVHLSGCKGDKCSN